MGVSVLVLGASGSGKSTSLRNFEPGEIGIFSVAGKPLPFRKKLTYAGRKESTYSTITAALKANNMRAYCIDDANYLMAFENFSRAHEKGFDKFTEMAVHFEQLLEAANSTNDDTIVYFLMHPDWNEAGYMKPKTVGKMLDAQLTVEGVFPACLLADITDHGFVFRVLPLKNTPCKTPFEMFDVEEIENDLKAVDTMFREYYGLKPLKDPPTETKDIEQ